MSNTSDSRQRFSDVYGVWEFDSLVFSATQADLEKRLGQVMIMPRGIMPALGTPEDPKAAIIVSLRGGGKSALKNYILATGNAADPPDRMFQSPILCAVIDKREQQWLRDIVAGDSPNAAFRRNVLICAAEALDDAVTADVIHTLTDEQRLLVARVLERRAAAAPEQLQSRVGRWLPRVSAAKRVAATAYDRALEISSAATGGTMKEKAAKKVEESDNDIHMLYEVARACGFKAIYVLVDELDEYEPPEFGKAVVAGHMNAIIGASQTWEIGGYAMKFLLTAEMYGMVKSGPQELRIIRTGNKEPDWISWTDEEIAEMLKRRLAAYSVGGEKTSLRTCCVPELADSIDAIVVRAAYHNPRHYIVLCKNLADEVWKRQLGPDYLITEEVLRDVVIGCAESMAKDIYGETVVDYVVNANSMEFTQAEFVAANGLKPADGRRILAELTKQEAVTRLSDGTRFSVGDTRLRVLINPEEATLT